MAEEEPLLYDPGSDSDSTERLDDPLRGGGNRKSALQTCCWVLLLLSILTSLIGLWYMQVHLWAKYLLTPCEEPLANWCMVSCFTTIFFLLSFLPCLICHAPSYRNALLLGFFAFEVAWTVVGSVWLYRISPSHYFCPGELFRFVWWQLTLTWGGVGLLLPLCGLWMCIRQCEDRDVESDGEDTRCCSWCRDYSCYCCDNGKELFLSHPPNSPLSPPPSMKQSFASSYDIPHSLPPSPLSSPYRSPSKEKPKKKKKQKSSQLGTSIPSSSFSSSSLPSSLPEQEQFEQEQLDN